MGLLLEILPLSNWATWVRPAFVELFLIFWLLVFPNLVGVAVAFFIGLLMDLLMNTLLGTHSAVFIVVAYIVLHFNMRIRLMPLWQQTVVVFVLVLFQQVFLSWLSGLLGGFRADLWFWLPALTSAIIWPWVYMGLRSYTKHYKLYRF